MWALAVALTGIIFSMSLAERRREMGVLRALGATRPAVGASLLSEAAVLALSGSLLGASFAALGNLPFPSRHNEHNAGAIPLSYGAAADRIDRGRSGRAPFSVLLAVIWPSVRMSVQEPAQAMRE